jgi:hypothetical protein
LDQDWPHTWELLHAGVNMLAQDEHPGITARLVDHVLKPIVDVAPRAHRERSAGDRLDVARAGLVLVRIGVRVKDLVDVDALATDVADEVSDLRRGGYHGRARGRPGASRAPAATGDKRRDRRSESDSDEQAGASGGSSIQDSAGVY